MRFKARGFVILKQIFYSFDQKGFTKKSLILIIFCASLVSAIVVPSYSNLKVKSLRAEAQVMLSYLAALETAYYTDNGKYVIFDEYYGSSQMGKLKCERPTGAVELGFILRSCDKDPLKGGLRYMYRVEGGKDPASGQKTLTNTFTGYAESGTDANGKSLVCMTGSAIDRWTVDTKKTQTNISKCE